MKKVLLFNYEIVLVNLFNQATLERMWRTTSRKRKKNKKIPVD